MICLLFGSMSALLTDIEDAQMMFVLDATTVDIELHIDGVEEAMEIDPGESFEIKPWIDNVGSGDVYAFIELYVPVVNGIPIIRYLASDQWTLVVSEIDEEYKREVYAYGTNNGVRSVLSYTSLEEEPLMTSATFNSVRAEDDMELVMTARAYAATTEASQPGAFKETLI